MYIATAGPVRSYLVGYPTMVLTHPTPKQFLSIPCPTCGVAAGMRCVLHSDAPRKEAHINRKVFAIAAMQKRADDAA
jgi:hypothetical protein